MTALRVGVTGSRRGGRLMWWFNWLSLRLFGVRPVRLLAGAERSVLARLDGLIIGGGDHIGAELYDGVPAPDVRIDPERDRLELKALEIAMPCDLPVLGVCRGAQMLNVFYGGSLHTDIYEVYRDAPRMWTPLPRKRIDIVAGTGLRTILDLDSLTVNSLHTQSVDRLGAGLRVSARDGHGIIQAIEDPGAGFRLGVQWHPEFLIYRRPHRRLFAAFAEAVAANRGGPPGDDG